MKLTSQSFFDNEPIPGEFAFAVVDPSTHITLSSNRNPHMAWSDVPSGTQSFVLVCHDPDVPSSGDDVNKEGREIPTSLPRVHFFHWLLLDIPLAIREIVAGSQSNGVVPRGKNGPTAPDSFRHGINSYTDWFAGDEQMRGDYYGYDGPCPPWNDALVHHYVFTLYAIDLPSLTVKVPLNGISVREALKGHVLAEASLTGTYTLNPRLQKN